MLQLFNRNQQLLWDDSLKKVNQAECTVQRQFLRSLLRVEAAQPCVHAYDLARDDRAPGRNQCQLRVKCSHCSTASCGSLKRKRVQKLFGYDE